jgi:DNA-binding transcriptional regulator PaaX
MGNLEVSSRKRHKKAQVRYAILASIAAAGLIPFAILAPNALTLLKTTGLIEKVRQYKVQSIYNTRRKLIDQNLIYIENTKRGKFIRITKAEERLLRKLELQNSQLKKPKRWDRKYRLVIFDIHEPKKRIREQIRSTLQQIGFYRLQNSVWVYPYDCEEIITLLKADYEIGSEVLYIIAEEIENDKKLRAFFKLGSSR